MLYHKLLEALVFQGLLFTKRFGLTLCQKRDKIANVLQDAYHSYLAERFSEGCTVAKRLWRELQQQGYTGSYAPVRRWVYMQKHYANQVVESKAIQATPKQLAYWFLRDEASLDESEKTNLQRILESLPALKQLRDFALTFKQA